MVKKNLKHALRAHEAKKAQVNKLKAVEEAVKRKALSIKSGKQPSRQKKKSEHSIKTYVRPFLKDDTILLVGEGNFSFAHSLLIEPHNHNPDLILATALDSEEECYEKYPDAKGHVEEIRRIAKRDSIVVFRVDAGNLEACKEATGGFPLNKELQVARWSKVVFNFPHLGAGHKDESRNILSNQLMLIRFLVSVAPLLSRGPVPSYMSSKGKARKGSADSEPEEEVEESEIESEEPRKDGFCVPPHAGSLLITVRNCKPYTMWDIPTLAKRLPSVAGTIIKTAPAMGKGLKAPSSEQIEKVLSLGQGKAYRVWRSFRFSPEQYTLYSHRRTIGWKQGRSTDDNEDILRPGQQQNDREIRTFELGLAD